MQIRSFNAPSAPQGFHAQVCAVEGATRLAFVSGQVPATAEGAVPESLAEQSRLIWRNIEAQLAEVGMSLDNVVKATTFLSDRKYAIENREIRNEVMGARTPAITVIICDLFDEAWLLESRGNAVIFDAVLRDYFESALDLTVCVNDSQHPDHPGFYLITLKGSQQAGLTGLKGGIVRKVAVGKTRSSLEKALASIKQKLESQTTIKRESRE